MIIKINQIVRNTEIVSLAGAYVLMLIIMFILPFFSVFEHSIIRNTLSQLGAENSPIGWLMSINFVSFGISSGVSGRDLYS